MTGGSNGQASAGYYLTFAIGSVALPLLGIGLGGLLLLRAGQDPYAAWNAIGMPCFIAGFAMIFAMRLIFRPQSSAATRDFLRTGFSLVFALLFVATVAAVLLLATTHGRTVAWIPSFIIAAALCQAGGVGWLLRYRREG